jgi:hypothetical protein
MLVWLAKRRMLADPTQCLWHYGTTARKASPELMLTTQELPYYVHLPAGKKGVASLKDALQFGASSTARKEEVGDEGVPIFRENQGPEEEAASTSMDPKVASIAELPELDEPLKEDEAAELRNLASSVIRSFEVVYDRHGKKPGKLLLSSRTAPDLARFEYQLNAVYSRMDYIKEDPIPDYLGSLRLPRGLS